MVPSRVRLLLVRGSLTPAFPRSCHQRRARGARRADDLTTATHPTREHHPAAAHVNRRHSSCTRTVLPAPRAEPCHVGAGGPAPLWGSLLRYRIDGSAWTCERAPG